LLSSKRRHRARLEQPNRPEEQGWRPWLVACRHGPGLRGQTMLPNRLSTLPVIFCTNCGLLEHYVEAGICWHRDADVLRIRRVRQLLFAGKRDVIRRTISQQRLPGDGPAEASAAANHVGGYGSHTG